MKYQRLRLFGVGSVFFGAAFGFAPSGSAATSDWKDFTSTSAQNWSIGTSWVSGSAPSATDPTLVFNFDPTIAGTTSGSGGTVSASFTALNDIGTVQLNQLNLVGKSDAGTTRRTITISGGTLDFRGSGAALINTTSRGGSQGTVDYSIASGVTLNANTLFDTSGTVNGGITTLAGSVIALGTNNLTLKSGATSVATVSTDPGALLLASTSTVSGSGNLVINGGVVSVSAANSSFTGAVQVSSGTLVLGNATANASNQVAIASGASVSLGNNTYTFGGINDLSGGGGKLGFSANNGRTLTLGGSGSYSYSGVLQDRSVVNSGTATQLGLTVALTGGGSQKLAGANTYAGITTLTSGTLDVTTLADGGLSNTTSTAAISGATTLQLGSVANLAVGQSVIANGIADGTTITAINAGTNTITLSLGTAAAITSGSTIKTGLANGLGISTNAATNLVMSNGAVLKYSGSGSSTDRAFTTSGGLGTVVTFDASGTGAVAFTNTAGVTHQNANATRTFALTGTSTNDNSFGFAVANNGTGAVSMTKNGTGKWLLAAANTYTGATTVNAGTLLVNGSIASVATVNAGTFGGSGSSSANVIIGNASGTSDASLAAGNSGVGTFTTTGSVALLSDGVLAFELNSTTGLADKVVGNGFTLASSSSFSFTDLGSGSGVTLNQVFTVLDNTSASAISGAFANLAQGSTFSSNGITYSASYLGGTGNDLILTAIAVPEPSTYVLIGTGLGVLCFLRRRMKISNRS